MKRSRLTLALLPAALLCLFSREARAEEQANPPTYFGRPWDLKRLSADPVKFVSASTDIEKGQVRFVLEFTRSLKPSDFLTWEQPEAPLLFRFLDEDGVVLRTLRPRYDSEVIPEKGRRFRVLLQLPTPELIDRTKRIVVE